LLPDFCDNPKRCRGTATVGHPLQPLFQQKALVDMAARLSPIGGRKRLGPPSFRTDTPSDSTNHLISR
jgi:hypothetical protein